MPWGVEHGARRAERCPERRVTLQAAWGRKRGLQVGLLAVSIAALAFNGFLAVRSVWRLSDSTRAIARTHDVIEELGLLLRCDARKARLVVALQ